MPRVNDTDSSFKKTEQVVGRPATTDHNINDEYFRQPPTNHVRSSFLLYFRLKELMRGYVSRNQNEGNALDINGRQYVSRDDMKREERESKFATTGATRITKTDELAESVSQDDSLGRRTTYQDVDEL